MTVGLQVRRGRGLGRSRARPSAVVSLFSLTLFVSAALVFLIQPMFAKFVLPLFGSTPAVWNTSMVFFQVGLLAAYLCAHKATRRLGVRRQAVLHMGVARAAAARAADRPCPTASFRRRARAPSRSCSGLAPTVGLPSRWHDCRRKGGVWTGDFSNLVGSLHL